MTTADRIREMGELGLSASEIARNLGTSRQNVEQVAVRHGITLTGRRDGLPREYHHRNRPDDADESIRWAAFKLLDAIEEPMTFEEASKWKTPTLVEYVTLRYRLWKVRNR